jgi:RNA polymerase sigma-70 factor (ECF subfamily)
MNGTSFCTEIPDSELLLMLKNDDRNAIELLHRKYKRAFLIFSCRLLPDKAACEDVVRELFMKLCVNRYFLKVKSSLPSYIYTLLRNKVFNYLSKQSIYQKHIAIYDQYAAGLDDGHTSLHDFPDHEKRIAELINRLPEKCGDMYVLHYKYGHSLKNVSAMLNRPVSTAEKQSRKATVFLTQHLKNSANREKLGHFQKIA